MRCNHCPFGSLGRFLQLLQRRLFGPFSPRTEFSMGSMWNVPTCSIGRAQFFQKSYAKFSYLRQGGANWREAFTGTSEQIDVVNARDLWGQDLRGRNWSRADLSGLSLYGAQCDGINLFGARLYRTDFQKASLRGAELAFSYAAGANFRGSDMRGCSLYRAEIGLGRRHSSADFTDALVNEGTDIPERKVFAERRLS
jgi:uncharacterized protein YjbI with pentapeptide repeats